MTQSQGPTRSPDPKHGRDVIGHALLELLCGALARKLRVESADQFDVVL
jgi:hypothetical protein